MTELSISPPAAMTILAGALKSEAARATDPDDQRLVRCLQRAVDLATEAGTVYFLDREDFAGVSAVTGAQRATFDALLRQDNLRVFWGKAAGAVIFSDIPTTPDTKGPLNRLWAEIYLRQQSDGEILSMGVSIADQKRNGRDYRTAGFTTFITAEGAAVVEWPFFEPDEEKRIALAAAMGSIGYATLAYAETRMRDPNAKPLRRFMAA